MNLRLISVPVSDVEASKAFYVEKLGFREVVDVPFGDGMRWCELAPPGGGSLNASPPEGEIGKAELGAAPVTISLVTWFDRMPPGSLQGVVLHVDDARSARGELAGRGIEISDVADEPWGSTATLGSRRQRLGPDRTAGVALNLFPRAASGTQTVDSAAPIALPARTQTK